MVDEQGDKVIKFDSDFVDTKVKAIIDRVMCVAIDTELEQFFGVRTRFGNIECETQRNKNGSLEFLRMVLGRVPGTPQLHDRFTNMVGTLLKRSKKLRIAVNEVDQRIIAQGIRPDYTMTKKIDVIIETIAHEHAKSDFLMIMRKVGDNLQKEVDTSGITRI